MYCIWAYKKAGSGTILKIERYICCPINWCLHLVLCSQEWCGHKGISMLIGFSMQMRKWCIGTVYIIYYKIRCVFVCLSVCHYYNIQLTSPPVLKLWDTQGYLWLPYYLTEVIKLIGRNIWAKKYFFSKKYFMSFLPHYCHSFRITVIPSGLLSFLPY